MAVPQGSVNALLHRPATKDQTNMKGVVYVPINSTRTVVQVEQSVEIFLRD